MTPINLDLSPMEARLVTRALRVVATQRNALRVERLKLTPGEWRAMLRAATKLEAAVDLQRRVRAERRGAQ